MLKVIYFSLCFMILFVATDACQYPVEASELPGAQKFLVINADLTETYGKINITYTLDNVNTNGAYLFPTPPKATAYVVDSKGNQTTFATDGTINPAFQGVVGESYKLYITADGNEYESTVETMRTCPEIDSISVIYTRESARTSKDLLYDGFDVYAQLTDIANQEDYYQWDWIHYESLAACDKIKEGNNYVQVPCNPATCWKIGYNTHIVAQADKLQVGKPIAQRVVRVPYATPPSKYYLRVEQRAITSTVFSYLKSLETQTENVGSLFDVPAQTRFSPNIHNVKNPSEKIIGVFNVFSSRYKIIYIDMLQNIPGATPKIVSDPTPFTSDPFLFSPCSETQYRTQMRPEGWID